MGLTSGGKSCIIVFHTTPVQGSYNITTNATLGLNQASVTYSQNSVNYYGQGGIVSVIVNNGKIKASIANIACVGSGTPITVSASLQCQ